MFFVTTITNVKPKDSKVSTQDLANFSTRCVGYHTEYTTALDVVENNRCDIWETIYRYAVIEEIEEGIYPNLLSRDWFEYNVETGKYEKIPSLDGENPTFLYPKAIG